MNEKPEKKVRRQYDREFKADAVRLVTEGGHRLMDVAREVRITPKMLSQWRGQLEKHTLPEQAFVGQGHDREAEVKRLERRITILEMERDILKKPSASLRSQNGDQEDALRVDFAVAWAEPPVAVEGVMSCNRRVPQRLHAVLPTATAGFIQPTKPTATEGCCAVTAHPRCVSPGPLLFGQPACSR